MKKFFETLKNIYKIEDLRARILYTLGILLIYRLGSKVVLPGVNPMELSELQEKASQGVLGILDMFSGGAFSSASTLAMFVLITFMAG